MTKGVLTAALEDDTSAVLRKLWINNVRHVECVRFNEIHASYWMCCAKDVIIRVREFFDTAQNSVKVGMIFCRGRDMISSFRSLAKSILWPFFLPVLPVLLVFTRLKRC
jgi:hypothetical protein